jgi:pantetheine-phosphate adenylyltransferase
LKSNSKTRIAVFPGSFDPITLGHVDIINRALPLFDKIIIAIGINDAKKNMWPIDERITNLKHVFSGDPKLEIASYKGLTADFCKEQQATCIIRGLRNSTDFTYEQTIGQANAKINGIDSIFLMCSPEYSHISSSIVRDIARNGGDYSALLPSGVFQ